VAEIQGVGQDITARRQAEEERQKLIGDLTRKNHDLEQFAFITSHNLRAPVANMLGLAALYNAEDAADPANRSVFEHFTLSAQRLDGIIQDLSDLLAVRKRHEVRQRVELAEVVENVRLSVSAQLERSGAQLRVDRGGRPGGVLGEDLRAEHSPQPALQRPQVPRPRADAGGHPHRPAPGRLRGGVGGRQRAGH
jgi:signal transduction histidine kinase